MLELKVLTEKLGKYEDELQKLLVKNNENISEINRLGRENEVLKVENEAFENSKLTPLSEDNKKLETKIKNLNEFLYTADEEKIRYKNENERLNEELSNMRVRCENREDLEGLRCSISALQELRFQNDGKIKVSSF